MKRWIILVVTGLFIVALSAWNGSGDGNPVSDERDMEKESVVTPPQVDAGEKEGEEVSLKNTKGDVIATATLTKENSGVQVVMDVNGLPAGTHGFHVHEKGVCEPPDFESAGGHYNPTDTKHGKLNPEGPHAGDFDNIEVNEDGKAHVEFTTNQISLEKGAETTLYTDEGTALVIHSDPDDYKSQPSGDAGERIACGVISD